MSEFQAYLKRMPQLLKDEVQSSKVLGFNLGIMLKWGAHTLQEIDLADFQSVPHTVWDLDKEPEKHE